MKNGTDLLQSQSIEFEVLRLDRFCCAIALSIVVENLLTGQFLESDGIPRLYLFVLGKCYDLALESEPKT